MSDHAGVTADQAELATRAVMAGIGAYLGPAAREFLAEELPPAMSEALQRGGGLGLPLEELVRSPGMSASEAHELVVSVCRVLAETLSVEALGALRAAVPPSVAALIDAPAREPAPDEPERSPIGPS